MHASRVSQCRIDVWLEWRSYLCRRESESRSAAKVRYHKESRGTALCQLFAATVGEDDVKLFKYRVRYGHPGKEAWKGTVVEIHVPGLINFKWDHSSLDDGAKAGESRCATSNRGV
jgi:hypothetical protein